MKERNIIFDNLRGISMLGVIAIHVGDLIMESGTPYNFLYLLCEVLSRYSVPTFFFISGYGLFYRYGLTEPLPYLPFVKKRIKSIGIPYFVMSMFYLYYYSLISYTPGWWYPKHVLFTLFFGLANYHIYFLVILMWFYLLFPLWRKLMGLMERVGLKLSLTVLFVLQLLLYKGSAHFWAYPEWVVEHHWIYDLLQYRLNYFVFFYLFIFMLGGVIARHYEGFLALIREHKKALTAFFLASAAANTTIFYRWVLIHHMPLEDTTNALQQLSTPGLVYTIASVLFFSAVLEKYKKGDLPVLERISDRSFLIYLIHPFFLDQIYVFITRHICPFNQFPMPVYYVMLVVVSYIAAEILHYFIKKGKAKGLLP
ncbi:MAG: acyltransferase [Acidaminococcus sp.]|jgi:peptidoglycan/LPS O-acetylase OafA/YrhL|nr:acyltransferase [Acidaminococcus sp.]MCI2100644.1 acyltransferase [Acidaminococcus sp.]MCI2114964.1 acyltransferase [Acidaminococcus sp.]MCI2117016.1 acyltransferase [Acidaminococcus sp.]